jgi:hypothetical protein
MKEKNYFVTGEAEQSEFLFSGDTISMYRDIANRRILVSHKYPPGDLNL